MSRARTPSPQAPIIVVEDDPDDELLTLRALSRLGLPNPVEVLRDGQAAVDWLIDHCKGVPVQLRPAFVLLDLKLPKLDGAEVLARLRAHVATESLPVVVFSSSDAADDVRRCQAARANAYVCKPVDLESYRGTVRVLSEFWVGLNVAA